MTDKEQHIAALIKSRIKEKDPTADVILFGSHARGDAHKESDWDILILLNQAKVTRDVEKAFRSVLFEVELDVEEPISTFVYSKQDWNSIFLVTPLYRSIQKKGIQL